MIRLELGKEICIFYAFFLDYSYFHAVKKYFTLFKFKFSCLLTFAKSNSHINVYNSNSSFIIVMLSPVCKSKLDIH